MPARPVGLNRSTTEHPDTCGGSCLLGWTVGEEEDFLSKLSHHKMLLPPWDSCYLHAAGGPEWKTFGGHNTGTLRPYQNVASNRCLKCQCLPGPDPTKWILGKGLSPCSTPLTWFLRGWNTDIEGKAIMRTQDNRVRFGLRYPGFKSHSVIKLTGQPVSVNSQPNLPTTVVLWVEVGDKE